MLLDELQHRGEFCIYGAQVVAYGAYRAILELCGRKPLCFAVKSLKDNPPQIEDTPVREVAELSREMFVIVAVTELVQKEVLPELASLGFKNVFALTQHEEHLLMSVYYLKSGEFLNQTAPFVLYEVRNHRDKPLTSRIQLEHWEIPIQAGAALTDKRIAELQDDVGENISAKNRQYCEMSAVYWIWKHKRHDWVGIEHYRRHLLVRPDLLTEDVDVLLPLPYMCYPDEVSQFRRFVSEDTLEALKHALKKLHPYEFENYLAIIHNSYQYTYNLLCARWDVFDDYCKWFFEITEYMESIGERYPEILNTRALSYVAEVLTNIYFMSHRNALRIRHVEKSIYV